MSREQARGQLLGGGRGGLEDLGTTGWGEEARGVLPSRSGVQETERSAGVSSAQVRAREAAGGGEVQEGQEEESCRRRAEGGGELQEEKSCRRSAEGGGELQVESRRRRRAAGGKQKEEESRSRMRAAGARGPGVPAGPARQGPRHAA